MLLLLFHAAAAWYCCLHVRDACTETLLYSLVAQGGHQTVVKTAEALPVVTQTHCKQVMFAAVRLLLGLPAATAVCCTILMHAAAVSLPNYINGVAGAHTPPCC